MLSNPTPRDRLVDSQGRPYFLWDNPLTLAELGALLADPDPAVTLGPALLSDVEARLRDAALALEVITRSPGFVRYVIERGRRRAAAGVRSGPAGPLPARGLRARRRGRCP